MRRGLHVGGWPSAGKIREKWLKNMAKLRSYNRHGRPAFFHRHHVQDHIAGHHTDLAVFGGLKTESPHRNASASQHASALQHVERRVCGPPYPPYRGV